MARADFHLVTRPRIRAAVSFGHARLAGLSIITAGLATTSLAMTVTRDIASSPLPPPGQHSTGRHPPSHLRRRHCFVRFTSGSDSTASPTNSVNARLSGQRSMASVDSGASACRCSAIACCDRMPGRGDHRAHSHGIIVGSLPHFASAAPVGARLWERPIIEIAVTTTLSARRGQHSPRPVYGDA